MQWIKASERLPEDLKRERPIRKGNLYWIARYIEEYQRWLTDCDQYFKSEDVEWLAESQVGQSPEPKEEEGNKMVKALERFFIEHPEEAKKAWQEVENMRLGEESPEGQDELWDEVLEIFFGNLAKQLGKDIDGMASLNMAKQSFTIKRNP